MLPPLEVLDRIVRYLRTFFFCAWKVSLSLMIREAKSKGLIQGVKVARGSPAVSHLLFADDSLLFAKASLFFAWEIKRILSTFEKTSGQHINFHKSALSFSPNEGEADIEQIRNIIGIDVVSKHSKYLGLPSFISCNKSDIFKPIVDWVANKVDGWKEKFFLSKEKKY